MATTVSNKQALLLHLQSTHQKYDNQLKHIQVISPTDTKWTNGVSYINDVISLGNDILMCIPIVRYSEN